MIPKVIRTRILRAEELEKGGRDIASSAGHKFLRRGPIREMLTEVDVLNSSVEDIRRKIRNATNVASEDENCEGCSLRHNVRACAIG